MSKMYEVIRKNIVTKKEEVIDKYEFKLDADDFKELCEILNHDPEYTYIVRRQK